MILPFLVNQHHFVCVLLNNFHLHKALFNPITRLRLWTENFLLHSFVTPINTLFNMPALTRCPCFLSTAIYHSGVSVLFFVYVLSKCVASSLPCRWVEITSETSAKLKQRWWNKETEEGEEHHKLQLCALWYLHNKARVGRHTSWQADSEMFWRRPPQESSSYALKCNTKSVVLPLTHQDNSVMFPSS